MSSFRIIWMVAAKVKYSVHYWKVCVSSVTWINHWWHLQQCECGIRNVTAFSSEHQSSDGIVWGYHYIPHWEKHICKTIVSWLLVLGFELSLISFDLFIFLKDLHKDSLSILFSPYLGFASVVVNLLSGQRLSSLWSHFPSFSKGSASLFSWNNLEKFQVVPLKPATK